METIEDIVREMREAAMTQNCVDSAEGLALASRIEAANKRNDEALAPILAIPTDALTGLWGVPFPDGGMMLTPSGVASAMRFIDAVREARRIYNGGDDE